MSVPLDRLYHYLGDCVNHDLIIYRWFPSGSRKLEDLNALKLHPHLDHARIPIMIAHDQEPLKYFYYDPKQIRFLAKKIFTQYGPMLYTTDKVLDYFDHVYMRSLVGPVNRFDHLLLLHSEKNSADVAAFAQQGFLPVYYWSHALLAQDWYRYARHDPKLTIKNMTFAKDFLIYNRAWSGTREYRLCFVEALVNLGLHDSTLIKFSQMDNGVDYRNHVFENPAFQIQNQDLHLIIAKNTYSPAASADYTVEDYQHTGIEVVLETLFDDARIQLTEKILRPIACAKPFILASTPNSLQYLRDYGFKTFDGLIDESYDSISDPKLRLHAILAEMVRIKNLDPTTKLKLFEQLYSISQQNQYHFFNCLPDLVIHEYQNNFEQAITILREHDGYKHLNEVLKILKQK